MTEPPDAADFPEDGLSGLDPLVESLHGSVADLSLGPLPVSRDSPPALEPAAPGSLKKAALSSAAWTMFGFVLMQVMRFGSNLILSRLLYPEVFGLMALVNAFILGVHMFTDVGIGPSIIQSHRGDDETFVNTAWTLQIIRGFLLWVVLAVLAWPVGLFYENSELSWLLVVAGAGEAILAFNSTAIFTLSRRLIRGRLVALEVCTYGLSIAITITWIWFYPTVWALVMGGVISCTIELVMSHFLLPGHRNRIRWDRDAAHELLHFGKWIFISSLFMFLAGQADRLIVGKVSLEKLGVYHFAAMLAMIPMLLMNSFKGQLIFPLYSRVHQSGGSLSSMFCRVHPLGVGFGGYMVAGLIGTGPTAVKCLYDYRYQDAGWMLQLLAIGVWFQTLEVVGGSVLWAVGRARAAALSNASKVVVMVVFAPVWLWLEGDQPWPVLITGLIGIFAAGDFVRYLVTYRAVRQEGLPVVRYDLAATVLVAVTSMAALWAGPMLWPDRVRPEFLAASTVLPEATFPANLSWAGLQLSSKRDFAHNAVRFLLEAGVVTVCWGAMAALAWARRRHQSP